MKTLKLYFSILVVGILLTSACTKEETQKVEIHKSSTDGQALIKGNVTYYDNVSGSWLIAPNAVIKIATDTVSKAFNQFWMADSAGFYSVKGLGVGSYYIAAQYTDKWNLKYVTAGYTLKIQNSVDDITLNFKCQ